MQKTDILAHWQNLPDNQNVRPEPIAYDHVGSAYNEDSIRITGSRQFIDQVLSRLKGVLAFENEDTRLQVNYQESADRMTKEKTGTWNCYVQVHERGGKRRRKPKLVRI